MPRTKHSKYTKPIKRTFIGERVYRSRLSLHETQAAFGARLRVNNVTVHKWETGRIEFMQSIREEILNMTFDRLASDGRLVPVEVYDSFITKAIQKNERTLVN